MVLAVVLVVVPLVWCSRLRLGMFVSSVACGLVGGSWVGREARNEELMDRIFVNVLERQGRKDDDKLHNSGLPVSV